MAARIRAHDWAATPLGPIDGWPQSLRTLVDLLLAAPSMMSLLWGPQAIHLYNDRFAALLPGDPGAALGRSAFETFARSRDVFATDVATGMAGIARRLPAQLYPVFRDGHREDAWFDVDYAPVRDEAGEVAGVLWTLKETTAQVLAERALREREARQRLLLQSWTQAEWETDPDGLVVADSPSWRAYTGQSLSEWLGYGWLDAIHPDDRSYADRQWRDAVATHGLVDAQFRLRAPGGGWRWTNVRAAPLHDDSGAIVKWVGMNIDIDTARRAEAAVRESEAKFRALFESMDEAYAVVEVIRDDAGRWSDFRFLDANPAFLEHTSMPHPVGRTATELLGTPNPRWTELYGQALDRDTPLRVQEVEPLLNRTFDLNIFALDRERNQVAVLFTDITARERIEAALRESEAQLAAVFEAIPAGLSVTEASGKVVLMNAAMRYYLPDGRMPSRSPERAGRWYGEDAAGRRLPPDRYPGARALRGETAMGVEMRYTDDDGNERWTTVSAAPIRDASGIVTAQVTVITDIDDLRRLQQRQQLLVSELQHRVRNILTVTRLTFTRTFEQGGPAEEIADRFRGRLDAMARLQVVLSRDAARMADLEEMLRDELSSVGAADGPTVSIAGPRVALDHRTAEALGMALHELATNALKYGALKTAGATLAVRWTIGTDDRGRRVLDLLWKEGGVPIPSPRPTRAGFGRELIEDALPYRLHAKTSLALLPGGIRCTISVPLETTAG